MASLHDLPRVKPVERHQPGGLGMDLSVFHRGSHVEQLDRTSPLSHGLEFPWRDRRDAHFILLTISRAGHHNRPLSGLNKAKLSFSSSRSDFSRIVWITLRQSPCYNILGFVSNYIPVWLLSQDVAAPIPEGGPHSGQRLQHLKMLAVAGLVCRRKELAVLL